MTESPYSLCRLTVLSDLQINYHDRRSLAAVHQFLRDFVPDVLALNGDIVDMTALSHYRLTLRERDSLVMQQTQLREELYHLRLILPTADIVYLMGNHEARLAQYITDHAPELEFLDSLSFHEFADLDFKTNGVKPIELVEPYGAAYEWHGVSITHGERIVVNTAKANLLAEGGSGISGHTHRLSSYFQSNRSGDHAWFESGCLCHTVGVLSPPPSTPGVHNWQQGFIAGYGLHEGEREHTRRQWSLYPVALVNHSFLFNGKLYVGATNGSQGA